MQRQDVTEYETPKEKDARDHAYVLFYRLQQYSELFGRIRASRYRFRAIFGNDATQPFEDLDGILRDLRLSARRLARIWARQGETMTEAALERHHQERLKNEAIFWEGDDPDLIKDRLNKVISAIEASCRPAIIERNYLAGAVDMLERANKAIEKTRSEETN